jgi:hypothetical protein
MITGSYSGVRVGLLPNLDNSYPFVSPDGLLDSDPLNPWWGQNSFFFLCS